MYQRIDSLPRRSTRFRRFERRPSSVPLLIPDEGCSLEMSPVYRLGSESIL